MGLQNSSKEKTKPKDDTVSTLPSRKGEAAPQAWNRSFVGKIIPNPSFSFCTKMSKLPCLVGQSHFISKFKFCFVVLQLSIYPSSQWNDVSQVHHCKNEYQMRWFCLVEIIDFNPAQTSKFYGHKKGGYKLNLLAFELGRKFLGESFTPPWDL